MIYRPRPTKRRSKAEIGVIKAHLYGLLVAENPMSVRQVFYRMVSKGVIAKTEAEYKSTIVRLLGDMRRAGEIEFDWIADSTRWMRKPRTYSSLENMLRHSAASYRRSVWDNQDTYVEVWLEKDALAGVLYEETERWDVPLMVTRGYPSLSYLHSAAVTIAAQEERGKTTHLYYFGDYDPSGLDIPRKVERDLREFAPDAEIVFERVAITLEQIEELGLQTRPTKRTDSRARSFIGESVEVDAIPPTTLRRMVSDCITRHVDESAYRVLLQAEKSEREVLMNLVGGIEKAA
jgi:hypothetical protein